MNARTPDPPETVPAPLEPETVPGSVGWRLAALETLLDRAGVAWSRVRAAGQEDEIAVVDAPATEVAALAGLAREIRLLGFRFTTLDLAPRKAASVRRSGLPDQGQTG